MSACSALMCDHCRNPGRCCSGFGLNANPKAAMIQTGDDFTALHLLVMMAAAYQEDCQGRPTIGLPFLPLYELKPGYWRWWCPLLGKDGRCTDYANRPRLCSDFTPGRDALCVEFRPEPGGKVELKGESP